MKFSIVLPTFQRRAIVVESVRALELCEFDDPFDIIVVVDGSTDGSVEALKELCLRVPLTVLDQPNRGAAAARNAGARASTAEIVLFLDDDMRADPQLLAEHARSHAAGADVVLGHLPLDPRSPPSVLTRGVQDWVDERLARLSQSGAELTLHDFLTGQISIKRTLFLEIGGFDSAFTANGSFGDEDVDLGFRLFRLGHKIVFNPKAVSWQFYAVTPRQHLKQWREAGRADVAFARKHPTEARRLFDLHHAEARINRRLWRPLGRLRRLSNPVQRVLRRVALSAVQEQHPSRRAEQLFFQTRAMEYWAGVEESGGIPGASSLVVLCYHSVSDLSTDEVLAQYGVPAAQLASQLDWLVESGFHFVSGDELVGFLDGQAKLPRQSLLLTFDDCYVDLRDAAPLLKQRRIPAVAFAVSGLLGKTNEWDQAIGSRTLPLLNARQLRDLSESGIEIGAHARTHRPLSALTQPEIEEEIAGSLRELEDAGLPRPRFFSYPHGEFNQGVMDCAAAVGVRAAFTVTPGRVSLRSEALALPRVEVLRRDGRLSLSLKLLRTLIT